MRLRGDLGGGVNYSDIYTYESRVGKSRSQILSFLMVIKRGVVCSNQWDFDLIVFLLKSLLEYVKIFVISVKYPQVKVNISYTISHPFKVSYFCFMHSVTTDQLGGKAKKKKLLYWSNMKFSNRVGRVAFFFFFFYDWSIFYDDICYTCTHKPYPHNEMGLLNIFTFLLTYNCIFWGFPTLISMIMLLFLFFLLKKNK